MSHRVTRRGLLGKLGKTIPGIAGGLAFVGSAVADTNVMQSNAPLPVKAKAIVGQLINKLTFGNFNPFGPTSPVAFDPFKGFNSQFLWSGAALGLTGWFLNKMGVRKYGAATLMKNTGVSMAIGGFIGGMFDQPGNPANAIGPGQGLPLPSMGYVANPGFAGNSRYG